MPTLVSGISQAGIERLADILMSMQRCFMVRLSEELARGQVSFPQFFLLGHISAQNPMSMTEIAEKMNHTTAAATGLVDRLENLGYIQRTHAENDRRKVLVRITNNGIALVDRIRQDMIRNLSTFMQELTSEEQAAWLQIYEKVYNYCLSKKPLSCSQ